MRQFIFVFFFLAFNVWAQFEEYKGNYPIHNFTNDDFHSPVQIWAGCQTKNGVFLFGNDEKILSYNNSNWDYVIPKYQMESTSKRNDSIIEKISNKKVYKLFLSSDSVVYAARQGSIGVVEYDSNGDQIYAPIVINDKLKGVWSIHELNSKELVFIAEKNVFILDANSKAFKELDIPASMKLGINKSSAQLNHGIIISSSNILNDSLVEKDGVTSFYFLNNENLKISKMEGLDKNENYSIRSNVELNGKEYIICQIHGFKELSWTGSHYVIKENLFSDLKYSIADAIEKDGLIWLATDKKGVVLINQQGQVIREFGKEEGLQDQNVFSFFFDNIGNLWLLLDNGISVIEFSSNVVFWNDSHGAPSKIEVIASDSNMIYIASRSGLYISEDKNNRVNYSTVSAINEATFDVLVHESDFGKSVLIVGYNGIYLLNDDLSKSIVGPDVYAWKLHPSPTDKNKVYVGGEGFLGYLEISDGKWKYYNLKLFESDIRSFVTVGIDVYASLQNKGVIKISDNDEISEITFSEEANLNDTHFNLAYFQDQLLAGTTHGMYILKNGQFEKIIPKNLNINGSELNIHRMYNMPQYDQLWTFLIIEQKNKSNFNLVGYFTFDGSELVWNDSKNKILEKGITNDIVKINDLLFFGTQSGPFALDLKKFEKERNPWRVYIDKILIKDSIASKLPDISSPLKQMKYGSSIRFNYTSSAYFNGGDIEYKTRLIGFTEEWSNYENVNFKIYDKLPHGEYTIQIQGRNQYNQESEIYEFQFIVLPPWYLTWWAYILYVLLAIFIVVLITRLSIRRVKEANKRLEEVVRERTKEIASQNEELHKQRDEISAKNNDILDSIKYAKRLQDTILPSNDLLDGFFDDYFVFYRPKDIVSGDFYWAKKIDKTILWSAVDCTGHGVPGAMVSIVGNNGLLRATSEFSLAQPNEILDKLRELVLESFRSKGTDEVKDGMDLGLAAFNTETYELQFAGANNGCVIIRKNEIIELKADKQPIGKFDLSKPFTNITFQLESGDCIYLFTDGYVDQFGGDSEEMRLDGGKKFKAKPFKKLLSEISKYDMKKQGNMLQQRYDSWRGEIDAIDDVCVFGVKVK